MAILARKSAIRGSSISTSTVPSSIELSSAAAEICAEELIEALGDPEPQPADATDAASSSGCRSRRSCHGRGR